MRLTAVLLRKARAKPAADVKSLALNVYFKHPDFGMKKPEILSRASAFLLAVDPPDEEVGGDGPYADLARKEAERRRKIAKQNTKSTPVGGPRDRELKDIGWLEFAPREARPAVHCVCSSHVLAPFLWKDYYPQDWLSKVRQEHCTYSLDVFDPENPQKSLGTFALNPYPIHHPEGRDVALVHLKQEEENLKIIKDLGVQIHYMRDLENLYHKGDEMIFDGYVVKEANRADDAEIESNEEDAEEDTRVFFPYTEKGNLSFHSDDRFFATTPVPLPEGLCGGPVFDKDGKVCGIVEGIVSKNNANKDIAGCAAFMPNFVMAPFIDFAERMMLQKVLPKHLFEWAVTAKTTNSLEAMSPAPGENSMEEEFERAVDEMRKTHTKEEIDAMLKMVQLERDEVNKILTEEGGDVEEVIMRVKQRTANIRALIHQEYRAGRLNLDEKEETSDTIEAEIVEKK